MRKFLFLLLLAPLLFSSDLRTEQKIYQLVIHSLVPKKELVKVWCDDDKKRKILNTLNGINSVDSAENADILLISKKENLQKKGMKFVTSYQLLEGKEIDILGGFFWQKGRPNILFLKNSLQKYNITLPESMQDYVEDEL